MDEKYIVAFEVSSSQIKGAVASVHKTGNTVPAADVESIAVIDDTTSVRYGRIQNLADAAKYVISVRERLQACPAISDKPITGAYVGVEGRSLATRQITAALNLPTEMEVTKDILKRLYAEAAASVPPDKRTLRILPRRYMVDNQPMNNPVGAPAKRISGDFTAVVCNPDNIRYLDMVFHERAGFVNVEYVVTPLAIADMVLSEEEKQLGCVLVDFGYQTTTISIYKDRALQYLATLPLGSHNITRDITVLLSCTEEKAEAMKLQYGDAMPENDAPQEVQRLNSFVQARANEIIANINAQIEYAGFRTADFPGGFIITGRAAKLRNFDRLLETNTRMKVRMAQLGSNINLRANSPDLFPTDYLSLLAIVGHVARMARNKEILDCVETPKITNPHMQPAPEQVQTPAAEQTSRPAVTPAKSQANTPQPSQRVRRQVDDDTLLQDDPVRGTGETTTTEAEPARKPQRNGIRRMISGLKNDLTKLLSNEDENI